MRLNNLKCILLDVIKLKKNDDASKFMKNWLKYSSYDSIKTVCKYPPKFDFYEIKYKNPEIEIYNSSKVDLVMHGCPLNKAKSILEHDLFRNSAEGYFGSGVYNTHCADLAFYFSRRNDWKSREKVWSTILISEVRTEKKALEKVYKSYWGRQNVNHQMIEKYVHYKNSKSPKNKNPVFDKDEQNRRFRITPFEQNELCDEFLVDASILFPRYVIAIQARTNIGKFRKLKQASKAL